MKGHELKNECPSCGYLSDAASSIEDEDHKPEPRDFSICIGCGEIAQFDEKLKLVAPTVDDLIDLQVKDPELWAKLNLAQSIIKARTAAGTWAPVVRRRK